MGSGQPRDASCHEPSTQTLLPPVLTGVIFLAIFGGALGGQLRTIVGVEYLRFILPGLLVMTVAGQAFANNSTSLFQAKNEGYIEDVLTSPIPPWQLLLGYMSGGLLRGWLSALVLALVAAPFAGGVDQPWLTLFALVLTGLSFAALGVITGMWADSFDQHSFIASVLITPLALVAGVFYVPDRLAQPWQTLTRRARERGVLYLGLNMQDAQEDALDFLRRLELDFPNVRDPSNDTARAWGVTGIPETFFIGRDGMVVGHVIGTVTDQQLDKGVATALAGRPRGTQQGGSQLPTHVKLSTILVAGGRR